MRTQPDIATLWRYYQRGYVCIARSGAYFRQIMRPALSHVYFQRAMPVLVEYARANHGAGTLPPGFGEQMEACPLTTRDLLHLDYAICLGYAEANPGAESAAPSVLEWPGLGGAKGVFFASDALILSGIAAISEYIDAEEERGGEHADIDDDDDDDGTMPPFDL